MNGWFTFKKTIKVPELQLLHSVFPARLGLKAAALARPEAALAFSDRGLGQSHHSWLGPGLAWPRPWLDTLQIE
jgi:hypothetical protein